MESLEALRELLVPEIQGEVVNDHVVNYAKLRERSPGAKLKKVNLHGVPDGSILIKNEQLNLKPVSL